MAGILQSQNDTSFKCFFVMKLSIVVPVYNVERYVRKCILSIINQNDNYFKDIELILVNDGTKDKSVEQILDLVDLYDNISLVNQENQGLSMARNNGMFIAKGDYVWFIDSDDWISSDAIKILMPYLDNYNDIVVANYTTVTENGVFPETTPFDEVRTLSGKESFRQRCEYGTMAQRGVYRMQFMLDNNITFKPGIYSQDDELCLRASYLAEKVAFLPQPIYYFLRTVGENHKSIMNSGKPKYGFDYITVSKSLSQFQQERMKEKDLSRRFDYHISILINNGLNAISKCSQEDQKRFCEMYQEAGGLNKHLYKGGGKYFVEAVLFSLFPSKMLEIYRLLKQFKS